MFDTIICKYKLPMPDDPKGYSGRESFQTKDLECGLSTYEIDSAGQLFICKSEGHFVEGDKASKSFFDRIGHFKITKEWLEPIFNTTEIHMYDYVNSNTEYDYSIEYKITFIKGIVDRVEIFDFDAEPNEKRKLRDIAFKKENEEWIEFTKTCKYKYFVKPYNKSIRFIFRKTSNILSFLVEKTWILERKFLI